MLVNKNLQYVKDELVTPAGKLKDYRRKPIGRCWGQGDQEKGHWNELFINNKN